METRHLILLFGILVVGGGLLLWLTTPQSAFSPTEPQEPATSQTAAEEEAFGFIRKVETSGSTTKIYFDDAKWLSGTEGEDAAIHAGLCTEDTRSECLPNDFFIENTATDTVAYTLSPDASIILSTYVTGEPDDGPEVVSAGEFSSLITATDQHWNMLPYHITHTKEGVVTQIQEQYVP